jgi:peptidoglycan/xylan/chitin deacetylase (PgdA/CDA1 family)
VIGVCCKESEIDIAREFFELFKTPWELYEKKHSYEVILVTANEIPKVDANLLVVFGSDQREGDSNQNIASGSRLRNVFLNRQGIQLPIYGNVLTFNRVGTTLLYVTSSSDIAGLKVEAPTSQVIRIGYDLFQEIAFLLSVGQPKENAHIPTLDIHISMLRNWIIDAGIPLVEIPPVPKDYSSFVCLTHDVDFIRVADCRWDHTLFGFLYRSTIGAFLNLLKGRFSISNFLENLAAVVSLPLVYIGFRKDFWLQFESYLQIEKGLKSTYFFIPYEGRAGDKVNMPKPERRAARYGIRDVKDWAKQLLERGYEIGVHGIDAWHDCQKGRLELNEVTKAIGIQEAGTRTHWLCFDSKSPKILEDAGFVYDATFGYNDTVGFRAGTAQVFRPLGAKRILEVPLHIQDIALFSPYYLNMTNEEASRRCKEIIDQVLTHGGVLTILWHLRSMAPERLWRDFYTRLLEQLKSHRVWFATGHQVTKWFRLRRAISFTHESFSDRKLSLHLEKPKELPCSEFVLRLYKPTSDRVALSEKSADYIEIPWLGEKSVTIPFE